MTIALCSIFRNSVAYMDRYFKQVNALRELFDIRLVMGEGDSWDHTYGELQSYLDPEIDRLIKQDHGGPDFGSIDHPQRWDQIATIVKPVVAEALSMRPSGVVWVESDLIWETEGMDRLIRESLDRHKSMAPMLFARGTDRFYDTWGYRLGGHTFLPHAPYFPKEPMFDKGLARIDSCGSCFVAPHTGTLRKWSGHWPFKDENLWLDPSVLVEHP